MPGNRIYISYRSTDEAIALAIYERAMQTHGATNVLINPENTIPRNMPVTDWVDALINGCHYIIIVIGQDWTGVDDFGVFKLTDGDMVYEEVAQALNSRRTIIPVLVDGVTQMPDQDALPESLHRLLDIQPIILRPGHPEDLDLLIPSPDFVQRLRYFLSFQWISRFFNPST